MDKNEDTSEIQEILRHSQEYVSLQMLPINIRMKISLRVIGCAIPPHVRKAIRTHGIKFLVKPSLTNRFYKLVTQFDGPKNDENTHYLIDQINPKIVPFLACAELRVPPRNEVVKMALASRYQTICHRAGRCCTGINLKIRRQRQASDDDEIIEVWKGKSTAEFQKSLQAAAGRKRKPVETDCKIVTTKNRKSRNFSQPQLRLEWL